MGALRRVEGAVAYLAAEIVRAVGIAALLPV